MVSWSLATEVLLSLEEVPSFTTLCLHTMQFGTVLVIAGLHCFKENIIDWMVETTNIKGNNSEYSLEGLMWKLKL